MTAARAEQGEAVPAFAPAIAGSTLPLPSRSTARLDPPLWASDLAQIAQAGFRHVDLVDTWLSVADLPSEGLSELKQAVAAAELELVGVSVVRRSIIDPTDGEVNMAHTFASLDATVALGATVLSIGFHRPLTSQQREWAFWAAPSPRDDPSRWPLAIDRLRKLATYAESIGVALSLELYENTLLGSGAAAARLVEAVGSAALGINADLANLFRIPRRLAESWLETLQLSLPHMNYWHVKNYRRAETFPDGPFLSWPTALEDGDIDYRTALRLAAAAGYGGPLCVEHYGGDALWNQQRGLLYLTRLLQTL
jgi:sugar phosphate isomerase/epimerase